MATNLKKLRINCNKSQKEISDLTNIPLRSYQEYESGRSEMRYSSLIKLADFFNCSVDYLLGHQINDPTRQKEATMLQRQLCNDILALDEDDCGRVEAYIAGIKAKNKETEKHKKTILNEDVDW